MFIHKNLLFRRPRRDAFTLIEMLVVIGVILILVGIAVPNFIGVMDRAKVTQCKTFIQELKGAVAAYNTDTRQCRRAAPSICLPRLAVMLHTARNPLKDTIPHTWNSIRILPVR